MPLPKLKEGESKKNSAEQPERRYIAKAEFRIEDEEGEPTVIAGYAAVFNKWSENLGFFKEKIRKGAFADSIQSDDIRALINHDPNLIIGRTKNKTLKLWEDDDGLGFEVKLPKTTYAADLVESIRRKDITQNSFGFETQEDDWSPDRTKRELIKARLFDISPVTFPAYKQTTVMVRLLEIGIDYEAIGAALIRAEHGQPTDSDVDLFNQTIGILTRYVPILSESIAPEPPKETVDYSALIRARIASKTIHSILGGKRA
jgi:hypothetical protein